MSGFLTLAQKCSRMVLDVVKGALLSKISPRSLSEGGYGAEARVSRCFSKVSWLGLVQLHLSPVGVNFEKRRACTRNLEIELDGACISPTQVNFEIPRKSS